MAVIRPFRAIRYNERKAGPLARLVAPPYDVIDEAEQERLYAQSPHNCVRLILNRDEDRYSSSAKYLATWIGDGILVADPRPAVYLYSVRFRSPAGGLLAEPGSGEHERIGFIGALQLEEYYTGVVRPHERTFSGPKSDRLALLRACRANLSPIFGLVSKPGLALRDLKPTTPPTARADLGSQGIHELWKLEDQEVVEHLAEVLKEEPVLIADGHHRYETALRYQAELATQDPGRVGPANYIMAFLANMEERGLMVLPTHRILHRSSLEISELAQIAARWAKVSTLAGTEDNFARVKSRLAAAGPERCLIAVVGDKGKKFLLLEADWGAIPVKDSLPEPVKKLEVTALHSAILPAAIGRAGEVVEHQLSFEKNSDQAHRRVAVGEAAFAFLLPPPSLERLKEVCRAGATMPEKSTYFFPKLLTGLAFRSVDTRNER